MSMSKTNTELSEWFSTLKSTEKIQVIRDGYNSQNISSLMENMSKILEEREREREEQEEVSSEDEIDEESIIANYKRLGHDEKNGAYYISTEGFGGIIYKNKCRDQIESRIRDQINIGKQFSCSVSFFIDVYKTNKLEYKTVYKSDVICIEISSIALLRPIIKIVTDLLKYEESRKALNSKLNRFRKIDNEIVKIIEIENELKESLQYVKDYIDTTPPSPVSVSPVPSAPLVIPPIAVPLSPVSTASTESRPPPPEISSRTGKPKRQYNKKI
jgi:hypothetical protein